MSTPTLLPPPAARHSTPPARPSTPPGDGHLAYRADVDGLRAVAVLAVVGFHAFPALVRGGFVGVDVFFVISGYLITTIILRALERGAFRFSTFYARRVRRIFPALLVVLGAVGVAGWLVLVARPYRELAQQAAGGAAFLSNVVLWREINYFDPSADTQPLLHLWSLAIEEQFYFVWPLLLWTAHKARVRTVWVAVAVCASSFVWNVVRVGADPVGTFYLPFSRLWELAAGGLLAHWDLYRARRDTSPGNAPAGMSMLRHAAAGGGVVLLGLGVAMLDGTSAFPGYRALIPVAAACLLIGAGDAAWVNRALLARRPLVWVGLISYPLYLWHWPLLAFARTINGGVAPGRGIRAGLVAGSVCLAWGTYHAVEQAIRQRAGRAATRNLLAAMATCLIAAAGVYRAAGVPSRRANRDKRAVFLDSYAHQHRTGLASAYRAECDYYDWRQATARASIDPGCVARGDSATVFLWGDSHAQALSYGLRQVLPRSTRLAQVATSGCAPSLSARLVVGLTAAACARSNPFARASIRRLRPDVVVLAQAARHDTVDWRRVADTLHAWGVRRVVLVGPAPQWYPSLPEQYARNHWGTQATRVREGLDTAVMVTDRLLERRFGTDPGVEYVSLQHALCDSAGCLAVVPVAGADSTSLLAVDYGHLTAPGSLYVARWVLGPVLLGRARVTTTGR